MTGTFELEFKTKLDVFTGFFTKMNSLQSNIYSNINPFIQTLNDGIAKIDKFLKPVKDLENKLVSNLKTVIKKKNYFLIFLKRLIIKIHLLIKG